MGWRRGVSVAAAIALGMAVAVAVPTVELAQATFPGAEGKIVFASLHGDIWTMNPDGSGLVNILDRPTADRSPTLSPDGTKIAFIAHLPLTSRGDVAVMNLDGSGLTNLTNLGTHNHQHLSWSPDGQTLLFGDGKKRSPAWPSATNM